MSKTSREQLYRDTAEAIPAGRVGEADDIAHAYLFCLTEPFATGSILTVDAREPHSSSNCRLSPLGS
jgi:NAD(P)-dependent dehydrogenase (short-subunit alcohol dehydrogenase family)